MAELTHQEKVANALIQAKGLNYGPRHDNPLQLKGSGFYGQLPRTDAPNAFSTELSGSMNGLSFPLIYQGISQQELKPLLGGGDIPQSTWEKAAAAAQGRMSLGLPAFALEGEQSPPSQIGLPPPTYGFRK